jgi:hypothetical protein
LRDRHRELSVAFRAQRLGDFELKAVQQGLALGDEIPYVPFTERLAEAMRRTGDARVVDLCSGGGGPAVMIARQLREHLARPVGVVLTDLYPTPSRLAHARAAFPSWVELEERPIDAQMVPRDLAGFRLVCNGFHHLNPEQARACLLDAVQHRQGVALVELAQRSVLSMLQLLAVGLATQLAVTPFIKPFRWSRLLYTYALPIVPLCTLWDGIVSCLRVYDPNELRCPGRRPSRQQLPLGARSSVNPEDAHAVDVPDRRSDLRRPPGRTKRTRVRTGPTVDSFASGALRFASMAELIYEMVWDCQCCGARKLLGLSHRHCPSCGAQQDPSSRYFPADHEKVAVQNHEFVGADTQCRYCGGASSKRAHIVGSAGHGHRPFEVTSVREISVVTSACVVTTFTSSGTLPHRLAGLTSQAQADCQYTR